MIDTFCSPCSIAEAAARSNNCIGVTDPNIVCMGTCRSLLDNFINSCDNAVSYISYHTYTCSSRGGMRGHMEGFNKDACGTKLLPTTVSAYPVEYVCFCHLLNTYLKPSYFSGTLYNFSDYL